MAADLLGSMRVEIVGDNSQLDKSIDKSQKKAKGFGKSLSKLFAGIGVGVAVVAVGKLTKSLINAASDAEETRNKFNVVFRDISGEAEAAAKNLTDNFGLSGTAAQSLLADTGDLLAGFGFTQKASLDLSSEVQALAVDLASFTNVQGGAKTASDAITKALLGERESMKTLGVSILEADVKAKVLELTQEGLTFETERQAKATATLALIQEQSGNAIGDFQRSSASFANQTKITSARIEDLQVALGEKLLPVANVGVGIFNDLLDATLDSAEGIGDFVSSADGIEDISSTFGTIAGVFGVLKEFLTTLWEPFEEAITTILTPLGDLKTDTEGTGKAFGVLGTLTQLLSGALEIYSTVVGGVVTNVVNLFNAVRAAGAVVGDFFGLLKGDVSLKEFKETLGGVKDAVLEIGTGIAANFSDTLNVVVDNLFNFGDAAKDSAADFEDAYTTSAANVEKKVKASLEEVGTATTESLTAEEIAIQEAEAAKLKLYQDTADERLRLLVMNEDAIREREIRITEFKAEEEEKRTQEIIEQEEKRVEARKAALETIGNILSKFDNVADSFANAEIQRLEEAGATEEEINKKKAQFARENAVRERAAALFQIAVDTPAAIVKALTAGPILGPILAGVIGGLAGAEVVSLLAAPIPKFTGGGFLDEGIVAGAQFGQDSVPAMLSPLETVLNPRQQAETLMAVANGGMRNQGSGSGGTTIVNAMVDKKVLFSILLDGSNTGQLTLNKRSITNP